MYIYIYSTILLHNTRECNKFGRIEDWLGRELSNKECGEKTNHCAGYIMGGNEIKLFS